MIEQILAFLIPPLISVVSVHWIFLNVLKVAKIKGLVDNPDARKLQKAPVPVLGGVAVFFGLMTGMGAYVTIFKMLGVPTITLDGSLLPVVVSASIMLYLGTLDDILGLTPRIRLVIEVLIMLVIIFGSGLCVNSLHGLWGVYEFSWWIGVPLTVFAGVGIINAYNMVDGVNGLSSGLCITCSVIFAVICFKRVDYADVAIALCFAASLIPFLLHNVFGKRSKMFIGDCGTMVMGTLVSWFMIRILSCENAESLSQLAAGGRELGLVAMMVAVTCVPVFDTLRVMTARMMRKQSPFYPDKTHLHHAFIAVGTSHSITALSEILINVVVVSAWYATYCLGASPDVQLYVVIILSAILVWGTYFVLNGYVKTNPNSSIYRLIQRTHFGDSTWWLNLQTWLDKGAYEDYCVIINKRTEEMNDKERDTAAIVNYLHDKGAVSVDTIIAEAGAEKLRVYPILFELGQDGFITVMECETMGAPKLVKLNKGAL